MLHMNIGMDSLDEHIIEAIGKARIVIRDGSVIAVSDPHIEECPLARRFANPVYRATPEAIKANIEERIRKFGMCRPEREVLGIHDFVMFGASELLSCGLAEGYLDCAVIVCDGAGTVIAENPALVQGIGGRMSGLMKTSPIPPVIARIERNGGIVPFPDRADIDQRGGVARAYELGYSRVAVTVADVRDADMIREDYPGSLIVGVHLSGVSAEEAERLVAACDIVSSCASRHIREIAGRQALLQGGVSIPVFALTQQGKDLILEKIRTTRQQVVIRGMSLPYSGENLPSPLF
jgi:putative methanogenesis marker protein 8